MVFPSGIADFTSNSYGIIGIFYLKYKLPFSEKSTLPAFIKKLEEKNQPEILRLQAQKAIDLFWKMQFSSDNGKFEKNQQNNNSLTDKDKPIHSKESGYAQVQTDRQNQIVVNHSTAENVPSTPKLKGGDWTQVYTELANSIQLRH